VFLQSLATPGQHGAAKVIDTLTTLSRRDDLDDLSVYLWGKRIVPAAVPTTQTNQGQFFTNRIKRFFQWANSAERTLEPMFERTTVESSYIDASYEAIVLPTVTVAEYHDGTLEQVTPHRTEGVYQSVRDHVDSLEAQFSDARMVEESSEASSVAAEDD
jgi:hypothetical protein